MGMNALQHHASTRTKDDIEKISHVYLDLDHGGTASLEALENSDLVPRPNYVLNTSPEKFQVVWKVEGMTIEEAEALNQAMVREFDGDPAATDSTRVLRLPGFANKKYEADFYVQARTESTQTYHLRDFKLQIDSQDAPRHQQEEVARKTIDPEQHLEPIRARLGLRKACLGPRRRPRRSHSPHRRLPRRRKAPKLRPSHRRKSTSRSQLDADRCSISAKSLRSFRSGPRVRPRADALERDIGPVKQREMNVA